MTNKEKFMLLVSDEKTDTIEKNKERIKNRAMLRESQKIALKVLMKLDELGWSQKDLAERMNVSPQQINKFVKGKENLTLETQVQLQKILDIPILATYYEEQLNKNEAYVLNFEKEEKYAAVQLVANNYIAGKVIKMECSKFLNTFAYQEVI